MRLALYADVHGNPWALDPVLRGMRAARPDKIAFLGDAVMRVPAPREAMQLLRSVPHVRVRGNYDWMVAGNFPGQARRFEKEPFLPAEIAWTREQLTADDLNYIETMPLTKRLFQGTPREVVLCHASPGKAFGGLFPPPERHHWGMTDEQCLPLLRDEPAPTVLCAHTHAVMHRRVGKYRIINPGSVSLGWNEDGQMDGLARWALLTWRDGGWDVQFKTERYDHRPVWEAYEKFPLWPELRRHAKPRWWGHLVRKYARLGAVQK